MFPGCESCRALLGHPDEGVRVYAGTPRNVQLSSLLHSSWRQSLPPRDLRNLQPG
jgi:hypothetical protein